MVACFLVCIFFKSWKNFWRCGWSKFPFCHWIDLSLIWQLSHKPWCPIMLYWRVGKRWYIRPLLQWCLLKVTQTSQPFPRLSFSAKIGCYSRAVCEYESIEHNQPHLDFATVQPFRAGASPWAPTNMRKTIKNSLKKSCWDFYIMNNNNNFHLVKRFTIL